MSRYIFMILPLLGVLLTGCPEHTEPNLNVAPSTAGAVRGRGVHRPGTVRPPRPLRTRVLRAR